MLEWREFVIKQKELELATIIEQEKLKPAETRKFVEYSFRDGVMKTTGTDIDKLMPPVSRFGGGNRAGKKQGIIDKLKAFCNGANKSTGSSHPCDQERWFDFICQTVDDGMMFDYSTLADFLQDESYWGKKDPGFLGVMGSFAWDEEHAYQLAAEYENACILLQYYKKTRG